MAHFMDLLYQWTDSPERSVSEILRTARRAVALDDRDPQAQLALAGAYSIAGPQDKMLGAAQRAIELNPSLAMAYAYLGTFQAMAGQPGDALVNLERGMRLSPQDPLLFFFLIGVAWAHFAAERYEDVVDWARRSLPHRQDWMDTWLALAASYAHLGRMEEARDAVAEVLRLQPDFSLSVAESMFTATTPDYKQRFFDGLRKAGLQ